MKRRRKVILILLAVIATGIPIAHYFISQSIARKLASTLQARGNVELKYDHAWYVPPYGMRLRGVRVTSDAQDVLTMSGLDVSLDRLPRPKQQIVISSIDVRHPVVRVVHSTSKPAAQHKQPLPKQKLSTLFKLTKLRISDGEIRDERNAEPMVWRNINVDIDTTQKSDARYSFALAAKDGAVFELKSRGEIDVDELMLDLTEVERAQHDADRPSQSLPPAVAKALQSSGTSGELTMSLAGQISKSNWALRELRATANFTDGGAIEVNGNASGPIALTGKPWWETIAHDITVQPHNFAFKPKSFPSRIEQIHGNAARLTSGIVQFRNLTGSYLDDQLELRSARLDLRELPRVSFREIDSTVTFGARRPSYSPKLTKVIEQLHPFGPFVIGGDFTSARGAPPQYDLRISSDTAVLSFAQGKILLSKVHGDTHLIPGRLSGENISAEAFGGQATVSGVYEFGETNAYRGHATLRKIDVQQLAERARGRGSLDADFESASGATGLNALQAKGEAEVLDGEFFELPVLHELFGVIKPARKAASAGEGATLFEVKDRVIHLRRAAINSPILGLQGGGRIGFDGKLNLEVVAAPLADWREKMKKAKIPIISDVAGEIAGGVQRLLNVATGTLLYQFRVNGDVKQPKITTVPVPILSDAGALLFGFMLKEKKQDDERLVDFLKAQQ